MKTVLKKNLILSLGVGAILFIEMVSEARAVWSDNCPSGTTAGTDCWSCGNNCTAYLTDANTTGTYYKKLNITGTGDMTDWSNHYFIPWRGNYANRITDVEISPGITSIGQRAFRDLTNVTSLTIPDSVTSIGFGAFGNFTYNNQKGITSLIIPDSVTKIDGSAFEFSSITELVIPDSWGDDGGNLGLFVSMLYDSCFATSFRSSHSCADARIVCQGDKTKCQAALNKYISGNACSTYSEQFCISSDVLIKSVDELEDKTDDQKAALCTGGRTDGMYEWKNGSCQRISDATTCNSTTKYYFNSTANSGVGQCQRLPTTQAACTGTDIEWNSTDSQCINKNAIIAPITPVDDPVEESVTEEDCHNNGQVYWDNQCVDEYPFTKKRWTPAEASEWLHEGNDNFVIITFKK